MAEELEIVFKGGDRSSTGGVPGRGQVSAPSAGGSREGGGGGDLGAFSAVPGFGQFFNIWGQVGKFLGAGQTEKKAVDTAISRGGSSVFGPTRNVLDASKDAQQVATLIKSSAVIGAIAAVATVTFKTMQAVVGSQILERQLSATEFAVGTSGGAFVGFQQQLARIENQRKQEDLVPLIGGQISSLVDVLGRGKTEAELQARMQETKALTNLNDRLSQFSPQAAQAKVGGEILNMQQQMLFARTFGNEVGELQRIQGQLSRSQGREAMVLEMAKLKTQLDKTKQEIEDSKGEAERVLQEKIEKAKFDLQWSLTGDRTQLDLLEQQLKEVKKIRKRIEKQEAKEQGLIENIHGMFSKSSIDMVDPMGNDPFARANERIAKGLDPLGFQP